MASDYGVPTVYGGFLQGLAGMQEQEKHDSDMLTAQQARKESDQIMTLRSLQIEDAKRSNELARSTFDKVKQIAQQEAETKRIKSIDDYTQARLDTGADGQQVADELIQQGKLPEGTIASKIPAPWDPSGQQKVWAYSNPSHGVTTPEIFNPEVMQSRYKEQIAQQAAADAKLAENGLMRMRNADGTSKIVAMEGMPAAAPKLEGQSNIYKLQYGRELALREGNLRKVKEFDDAIKKENEGAFAKAAAEGSVKSIFDQQQGAISAVKLLQSNKEAIALLNSGMITGMGAQWVTSLGRGLQEAGVTLADNATDNAQAYFATAAARVGEIIKQFGAGTGLSDADREFATKAAGGDITVSEGALRKIIDINNRAAQNTIKFYNENISRMSTEDRAAFAIDPEIRVAPDLMSLNAFKAPSQEDRAADIENRLKKYQGGSRNLER